MILSAARPCRGSGECQGRGAPRPADFAGGVTPRCAATRSGSAVTRSVGTVERPVIADTAATAAVVQLPVQPLVQRGSVWCSGCSGTQSQVCSGGAGRLPQAPPPRSLGRLRWSSGGLEFELTAAGQVVRKSLEVAGQQRREPPADRIRRSTGRAMPKSMSRVRVRTTGEWLATRAPRPSDRENNSSDRSKPSVRHPASRQADGLPTRRRPRIGSQYVSTYPDRTG